MERDVLRRFRPRNGLVARVDGVDLHWVEAGRGPALVLLHGLGDSHLTWSKVMPVLSRTRRVLVPDLCGHGHSTRADAAYTLDWHARILSAWIEQIGVPEVDVVGHSYGGGVAQWMLLNPEHRIRKLGLVSAGGLGREVNVALRLAATPFLVEHIGQPFMAAGTFIALQAAIRGIYSTRELVRLSIGNARLGTARAFARSVRNVIDLSGQHTSFYQHAHELRRVPPIGLFWGDDDAIIPVQHAVDAARLLENAYLARFAKCGHYPHRERPGTFVDALEEFLSRDVSIATSPWSRRAPVPFASDQATFAM